MDPQQKELKLLKENIKLTGDVSNITLKLHYAEMVLEDIRDECKEIPADVYQDMQTLLNSETVTPRFGFIVHPDGKKEQRIILDEMTDIQAAVGGYFEIIEETEYWWVYADEDGRDKALESNSIATKMLDRKTRVRIDSELLGQVLFVFKNHKDLLDKKSS